MVPDRHALPALAALLAFLAVTAPAAVPATAGTPASGTPSVLPVANTTDQATPEGVTRREFGRADVDVAAAVAVDAARLGGRHARLTLAERLDRAGSASARLTAVRATLDGVEASLNGLDARHERLLASYGNGSLRTSAFLRRLAVLKTAAGQQRALVEGISRQETGGGLSLPTDLQIRLFSLRGRLVSLPNPVVDGVTAALAGRSDPLTLYLEAASDGLVASAADGDGFQRVATLRGARRSDSPDTFVNATEALGRAGELYPWLFANAISSPSLRGFGDTSVYLIEATHPQGTVRTYLDGASRAVFHEIQSKDPGTVPVAANLTTVTGSLRLRVEMTYATGPMTVEIARPATGAPVDAVVRIDGQRVGTTGPDGRLRTIQPVGRFEVNATDGDGSVALSGP